jgi:hypothetical protein
VTVEQWILIREIDAGRSPTPVGLRVAFGQTVVIGRDGDLPLGRAVNDTGISRRSVVVSATPDGWQIETVNRNGAVIHPWGLMPYRAQRSHLVRWPLVGVRVLGSESRQQHWVLLESENYLDADGTAVQGGPSLTTTGPIPPPLAPAELSALELVFADYLTWPPPINPPEPRQLKQVASRLGKSLSGVQDRLRSAQEKALRLGLARPTTLTHPDYFHVLVAAGYVRVPTERPGRRERTGSPPTS